MPADPILVSLAWNFALVLARVGPAIMLLPGFGEAELTPMPRAGIAAALTLLLTGVLAAQLPPVPDSAPALVRVVLTETAIGVLFGFSARLAALALPLAAQLIAYAIGLSSVIQPDPDLGPQSTALAKVMGLAVPLIVLSTGLYGLALEGLARSYDALPAGGALPADEATLALVGRLTAFFRLGATLAMPFFVAGFMWHGGQALLTRLTPRLNVQSFGIAGQLLGGVILLGLFSAPLIAQWTGRLGEQWRAPPIP